jgi:hypothetical protein
MEKEEDEVDRFLTLCSRMACAGLQKAWRGRFVNATQYSSYAVSSPTGLCGTCMFTPSYGSPSRLPNSQPIAKMPHGKLRLSWRFSIDFGLSCLELAASSELLLARRGFFGLIFALF